MWDSLGFRQNPYDANPLKPKADDVELLVGRETEAVEFCTALEVASEGVFVISGTPGVGKTSFFNVQQYLLETGKAPCGPSLICARELCPVQPTDTAEKIALRVIYSLQRSVSEYCSLNNIKLPKETEKIGNWIQGKKGAGYDVGLQICGFGGNIGRQVDLPAITDISFEGLRDIITCIVSEVITVLGKDGIFVVLDNIENLEDSTLADVLITFRDTLFSISNIWWILIGQSGLGSLIQNLDRRVSDRISGTPLELDPILLADLYHAIEKRVARFHSIENGKAPLPQSIHEHLYDASHGEIRFVFKYCSALCMKFVTSMRIALKSKMDDSVIDNALGNYIVGNQIPEANANLHLQQIVTTEIKGMNLKLKEKQLLIDIGTRGSVRAKDFKELGFKTMQELSSNYLSKLHSQNLLTRKQEGRAVIYRLRGISSLAVEFGLLT